MLTDSLTHSLTLCRYMPNVYTGKITVNTREIKQIIKRMSFSFHFFFKNGKMGASEYAVVYKSIEIPISYRLVHRK